MTASFPGALKSFTAKTDGGVVFASHVNDLQDEVTAIETALGTNLQNIFDAPAQLRLTLASGTPITTTDQTAKTEVFVTPYQGNQIALWTGQKPITVKFNETSINIAALTANKNYDVFGYLNSGAAAFETLVWTNDTTRATGLSYTTAWTGILCKSGDATRRYLGSFRTTGTTGQTEDSLLKRYLWSYYNRVPRLMYYENATAHNYTTGTWRQWNADATALLQFISGLEIDPVKIHVAWAGSGAAGQSVGAYKDGTNNADFWAPTESATSLTRQGSGWYSPVLGYHYVAGVEIGIASAAQASIALRALLMG